MAKGLWGVLAKAALGLLGGFLVLLIGGVTFAFLAAHGTISRDDAVVWTMTGFAVYLMIWALWIGAAWMGSIDEAAREAHKAAWYWGGCAGMAVGGVGIILAGLDQAKNMTFTTYDGRTDPVAYMAVGATGIVLLMLAGYTIVWAWWWLARR